MPFLKVIKESYTKRQIENSRRNGLRHKIFSPKTKGLFKGYYVGEWQDDVKAGRGRELNRDGWMYDGSWLNNKKHGCGILSKISKENHVIRRYYIGGWVAGKKQGFGYNWFEDGSYYEGDFCRNKRHGYGRMWYCNGDYYEGAWEDDLYHGMGMLIKGVENPVDLVHSDFNNGNRYEGLFFKGKKEGYGTYYHIVSGQIQHGYWTKDCFINGTMVDADFRQSAIRPTPYPIPQFELMMHVDKSQDTCEVSGDDNDVTELTFVEHSCKRPPRRIVPNYCVSVNTCPCLDTYLQTNTLQ